MDQARRIALIEKKNRATLNPDEAAEFSALQRTYFAALELQLPHRSTLDLGHLLAVEARLEPSRLHYLKCWPESFQAIKDGLKTAELRLNDRGYRVGDRLLLREYDPETDHYSGDELVRLVTHVLPGGRFGLAEGYVLLSLRDVEI